MVPALGSPSAGFGLPVILSVLSSELVWPLDCSGLVWPLWWDGLLCFISLAPVVSCPGFGAEIYEIRIVSDVTNVTFTIIYEVFVIIARILHHL
jgi:hypothetical protein